MRWWFGGNHPPNRAPVGSAPARQEALNSLAECTKAGRFISFWDEKGTHPTCPISFLVAGNKASQFRHWIKQLAGIAKFLLEVLLCKTGIFKRFRDRFPVSENPRLKIPAGNSNQNVLPLRVSHEMLLHRRIAASRVPPKILTTRCSSPGPAVHRTRYIGHRHEMGAVAGGLPEEDPWRTVPPIPRAIGPPRTPQKEEYPSDPGPETPESCGVAQLRFSWSPHRKTRRNRGRDPHTGTTPRRLHGLSTVLFRVSFKPWRRTFRVSRGSITSSMRAYPAAR